MRWRRPLQSPATLETLRNTISAKEIIEKLQNHCLGKMEMQATQISAAITLLKKVMPDLQGVELSGDPTKPVTVQEVGAVIGRILPELAARDPTEPDKPPLTH